MTFADRAALLRLSAKILISAMSFGSPRSLTKTRSRIAVGRRCVNYGGMNLSQNMLGALLMVASMVSFTMNDVFIKLTNGAIPLAQLLTIRGAIAVALFVPLAVSLRGLKFDLGARAWRLIALRAVAETATAYFFLTALLNMPLANVTAIMQALPLTVALGALVFFRDPIGWRRMLAILVGLIGVLIVLRPGPDGFSVWSIYVIIAVICVTARDLITRKMPDHVPSMTVAVANTINITLFFGLLSLTETWAPLTPQLWFYVVGSAVFIIGGYLFSVQVMRVGEMSFVAPFRYSGLIAALILGYFVFDDWPDRWTLAGAGIVVAAGLFTLWRERKVWAD